MSTTSSETLATAEQPTAPAKQVEVVEDTPKETTPADEEEILGFIAIDVTPEGASPSSQEILEPLQSPSKDIKLADVVSPKANDENVAPPLEELNSKKAPKRRKAPSRVVQIPMALFRSHVESGNKTENWWRDQAQFARTRDMELLNSQAELYNLLNQQTSMVKGVVATLNKLQKDMEEMASMQGVYFDNLKLDVADVRSLVMSSTQTLRKDITEYATAVANKAAARVSEIVQAIPFPLGENSDVIERHNSPPPPPPPKCVFCLFGHKSKDCEKYVDAESRRSLIASEKRCANCLGDAHEDGICPFGDKTCPHCHNNGDHESLCGLVYSAVVLAKKAQEQEEKVTQQKAEKEPHHFQKARSGHQAHHQGRPRPYRVSGDPSSSNHFPVGFKHYKGKRGKADDEEVRVIHASNPFPKKKKGGS